MTIEREEYWAERVVEFFRVSINALMTSRVTLSFILHRVTR